MILYDGNQALKNLKELSNYFTCYVNSNWKNKILNTCKCELFFKFILFH